MIIFVFLKVFWLCWDNGKSEKLKTIKRLAKLASYNLLTIFSQQMAHLSDQKNWMTVKGALLAV